MDVLTASTLVLREALAEDLVWAFMIVAKRYEKEGYFKDKNLEECYQILFAKYCASGPKTTLVVELEGKIVGTITYQVGGKFPIEVEYAKDLKILRSQGVPVAYVGLFATEEGKSPLVAKLLMDTVQERVDACGETITVIIANDRRMKRYIQLYGFKLQETERSEPLVGMSPDAKPNFAVRDTRQSAEEKLAA